MCSTGSAFASVAYGKQRMQNISREVLKYIKNSVYDECKDSIFNMLSIPINSFTNHKKGIRAPKPLRFCLVRTYDKFEKNGKPVDML